MDSIDVIEQHIADRSMELLKILLKDKTTGKYIKWATDNYLNINGQYRPECEMEPEQIIGRFTNVIQPRVSKSSQEQLKRTRDKAEVFTPMWVVNKQNNLVDNAWFERDTVFNVETQNSWKTIEEKIEFPAEKTWQQYVDLKRLEISCGEAPYLVNRYDAVSGEPKPILERVGLLDRKLRIINENVNNETEWLIWVTRAFQSIYGYEYQGDSLLIARENLLYTFSDNLFYKFGRYPTLIEQKKIANIIAWNIWQMDGVTMTAPYSEQKTDFQQLSLFDLFGWGEEQPQEKVCKAIPCKIFDWRSNQSIEFKSMMKGV